MSAPKGYGFQRLSEMEGDEEEAKVSNRLRWKCRNCEASNRLTLRKHRLVKRRTSSASEAVSVFRSAYRGRRAPSRGLDAAEVFRESYGQNNELAHWRACVQKHAR